MIINFAPITGVKQYVILAYTFRASICDVIAIKNLSFGFNFGVIDHGKLSFSVLYFRLKCGISYYGNEGNTGDYKSYDFLSI